MCLRVYLYERVVGQTAVESLGEHGEVLRAVHSQHGVQKPGTTWQHHRMELWETERRCRMVNNTQLHLNILLALSDSKEQQKDRS